jgi:hypothetical protein
VIQVIIFLSLCLTFSLSLCLSVSLSLCPSVSLSLSVPLSLCLSVSLSQPFSQVGQNLDQKLSVGKNIDQKAFGVKNSANSTIFELIERQLFQQFFSNRLGKSLRGPSERPWGQKWPAGPALATPALVISA